MQCEGGCFCDMGLNLNADGGIGNGMEGIESGYF